MATSRTCTKKQLLKIAQGKARITHEVAANLAKEILLLRYKEGIERNDLIESLRAEAGSLSVTELADKHGITESAVWNIGNEHGISFAVIKKQWSPDDDIYLVASKVGGVSNRALAEYFGVTINAIKNRCTMLRSKNLLPKCLTSDTQ